MSLPAEHHGTRGRGVNGAGEGKRSTRAERERVAAELRARGLVVREIAERMGVAPSTADAYLNDPGGHKLRARKDSYRGICPECGGPTDGSNGPRRHATLCASCRQWTVEEIVAAMQGWAAEHGRPPRCEDWRGTDGGEHPSSTCVVARIGWNEALLLAGLPLTQDKRPETQQWVEEQIRAGRSPADIAAERGWVTQNVYERLRYHGTSVSKLRGAA